MKDLNVRPATLKLLQERAGHTLKLISIGNNFLIQNSNGSATKRKD
jgi:hypothetical protein